MKAAVLHEPAPIGNRPLQIGDMPVPQLQPGQVLLRVKACGVCRTDLHIVEGDLPPQHTPSVPGHQIVGEVVDGATETLRLGARVGVSWIGGMDGSLPVLPAGQRESLRLADLHRLHGEWRLRRIRSSHAPISSFRCPAALDDLHAAPLLCAGIIGFRSLRVAGVQPGEHVGLFGFGASAHLAIAVCVPGSARSTFRRAGESHRQLAAALGRGVGGRRERPAPCRAGSRRHLRAQRRCGGGRAFAACAKAAW